ncbi:PREDICTED: uncharacterized protein LOC104739590 [Camelina sativa]|uniref:Uncharacterized protein LOC104739590 n=1 Tax=Camelina sativa TaxID=90675 RepID=A0ABM0VM66_CAMSA|nr:PREDICTED: uncharacterized protein LOC104739590 [Camelina sativa]
MSRKFRDGEVRDFWDLKDFPVPKGRKIRDIIDSVLMRRGYIGEVSITAYGEKDPEDNPLENGITFVHRRDKYWRLNKILVDFALAAADNHEPHLVQLTLMVVAENIKKDTEFFHLLRNVNSIRFNVLLVVPDVCHPEEVPLPFVSLAWRWTDLLQGGDPMPETELLALLDRGKQEFIW